MRRVAAAVAVLFATGLLAIPLVFTGLAAEAFAAGVPSAATVGAALKAHPLYVAAGGVSYQVDGGAVGAVIPADTYLAVLPPATVPAGDQADELPALLSRQVGRGGTFVVLLGGRFYGSSTTLPGRLGSELGTAQGALPARGGDATDTLVSLMRSLAGNADLQDTARPARAGGPVGASFLIAAGLAAAAGAAALWWWLRRPPRARRRKRGAPPRDLVEIDYEGNIVRRTPASERQP